MTTGVLLITHENVAKPMLECAYRLFGKCTDDVAVLEVALDADVKRMAELAATRCDELDAGEGVLILTDLHGATPANIACGLVEGRRAVVVSGLSMPMLARVCSYRTLPLAQLLDKVVLAGAEGVVVSDSSETIE